MLRILSSKLLLAKTLRPLTYFSTKESSNTSSNYNEEIKVLKQFINIENIEVNKEPGSYAKLKVKKETDPVIRPKITLRDRIKKQKWETLADIAKDNPEFLQAIPAARECVLSIEDTIDYGFDIHLVGPVRHKKKKK